MRYSKATLILSMLGTFAAVASAQSFSGSVDTLCNVTGGSRVCETYSVLAPGQTSTSMRLDNAGPGITGFGQAYAGPGLLLASDDVSSIGTPYGQSWGKAYYRDAVRWTGTSPITVRINARLGSWFDMAGSNSTSTAGGYANFTFFADGYNINQTMQRSTSYLGYDTLRGAITDVIVTLQPGKWYSFTNTLQSDGGSYDHYAPYSANYSRGNYSLKLWFEAVSGGGVGTLQSGSGHDYAVEPVIPAAG